MSRSLVAVFSLAASAAFGLITTGALAAGGPPGDFRDPETGLEVKVPATFVQAPIAQDQGVLLKRVAAEGVFCRATFAPDASASAAEASVKEIARRWRASPAAKGRALVSAAALGPRRPGPPSVVAVVSDRRGDLVGFPGQRRRQLTFLWYTRKGLTSLDCEAPKVRFGILRREFEDLARGVTPPR